LHPNGHELYILKTWLNHDSGQGDLVGRIKEHGSDSLGHWSWIKLVGKNQKLITVILAYQVCSRPTNQSGTTAYHQQESCSANEVSRKPNRGNISSVI
jgi:hypothetical protein